MLNIIIGRAGSGKSTEIRNAILTVIHKNEKAILIVPEQFSFESEKSLYRILGGKNMQNVEVLSFTRLSNKVFREYGGLAGKYIDPAGRCVLMSIALNEIKDDIVIYKRQIKNTSFVSAMVQTITEFKTAFIKPKILAQYVEKCEDKRLQSKLKEISLIYCAYDAILERSYIDNADDLRRAGEALEGTNFFSELHVFIDGFMAFMSGENQLLKHIIRSSKSVTAAFTTDDIYDDENGIGVFSPVKSTVNRLIRIAKDEGVPVLVPTKLEENHRFQHPELIHVEKNIFSPSPVKYTGKCKNVHVVGAESVYDEIDFVAVSIQNLIRKGFRYNDIAVISRENDYNMLIHSVFKLYDIPHFLDMRVDIENKALINVIISALETVKSNYRTEKLMAYAKSPLLGFKLEDICDVENYAYLWSIQHLTWLAEFQNHPKGLNTIMNVESSIHLARVNEVRECILAPLKNLKAKIIGCDGKMFAKAIYEFLEEAQIAKTITEYYSGTVLDENAILWDEVMTLLDTFANTLVNIELPLAMLIDLFKLGVSEIDIGLLPQTLDEVIVGQADRIRPEKVRAVFVVGANEGIFPKRIKDGGLLNESERDMLINTGINLSQTTVERTVFEKYFAYFALTLPSEQLYASYAKADKTGKILLPSAIITSLTDILNVKEASAIIEPKEKIVSKKLAMDIFSQNYLTDNTLTATLRKFIGECEPEQLKIMDEAVKNIPFHLDDTLTKKLFGMNMKISPSRLEKFYECPFAYFLSSGLKLQKRNKVEFTPLESGSVIHMVLQVMVSKYGGKGLSELNSDTIRTEISNIINVYLDERIEDRDSLPNRFKYLFSRLVNSLEKLIIHIAQEFLQSEFEPEDFELIISENSAVKPMVLEIASGGTIRVEGIVDRVDVMKKGSKKYVRVVDYKSGAKLFSLSDVYYGLNMQMLIYLFSIWENNDILPAGVLYMPAGMQVVTVNRDAGEDEMKKETAKILKMNGLILDDEECLRGMERDGGGIFIPVKKRMDSSVVGSVASLAQMGLLKRYVQKQIVGMAKLLREGSIPAHPSAVNNPCRYCEYKDVCKNEEQAEDIVKMESEQFWQMAKEEANE